MPQYHASLQEIDIQETKRYAGLNKAPNFNMRTISEACREVLYIAQPRGSWEIYDYDAANGIVKAPEPFVLKGQKVTKHLCQAQKVVIIAATIGEEVEEEISRRFQLGEYTLALLMDAACTTAVEQVADDMEKTIIYYIQKQGLVPRWRFSPGYGDWPLKAQRRMLELSKAESIGMKLTDSLMLMPRKSITAIIGLVAKKDAEEHNNRGCQNCDNLGCNFRSKAYMPKVEEA